MIPIVEMYNPWCANCSVLEPTMYQVGAFRMCESCVDDIFPEGYDPKSKVYKKYLGKYDVKPTSMASKGE